MAYLFPLRNLASGWTLEQRRHYFTTLNSYPQPDALHDPTVSMTHSCALGSIKPNIGQDYAETGWATDLFGEAIPAAQVAELLRLRTGASNVTPFPPPPKVATASRSS